MAMPVQVADKVGAAHEMGELINERPDWEQRLSGRGVEQTQRATTWLDPHLGAAASFDLRYFSPLLRTRETAAYLGEPECAEWIFELLRQAERAARLIPHE